MCGGLLAIVGCGYVLRLLGLELCSKRVTPTASKQVNSFRGSRGYSFSNTLQAFEPNKRVAGCTDVIWSLRLIIWC